MKTEKFIADFADIPTPRKKMPELDALTMASNAIQEGASGVDMGRNIFQSENPVAMLKAVKKVVHEDMTPQDAYQLFLDLKAK